MRQAFPDILAGRPGPLAVAARAGLAALEPAYAAAVVARRRAYERGWLASADLGRPTVSVGNLTVGGTGKTPVVRWLAESLRTAGRWPAVLSRGYAAAGGLADEPAMLDAMLNLPGELRVPVVADADRVAGARRALAEEPSVDVFLLDDGFQHLRARRDFDLVLIDATRPFGAAGVGGRVLPRGLMREPASALSRADALLLTRFDRADTGRLGEIESVLRRHSAAPIYKCRHAAAGYVDADGRAVVSGGRAVAVCGIGHPAEFFARVSADYDVIGRRAFADHHAYTAEDAAALRATALAAGAAAIVVTEKDWVKLARLPGSSSPDRAGVVRAAVRIEFEEGAEVALFNHILSRIRSR